MKTIVLAGWLIVCCAAREATAQGSLTPSGPPSPSMRTLQQIEPRTPIAGGQFSDSGYLILQSGHYYLTGDIIVTNENAGGIVIFASNVTLDLNGFTVRATKAQPTNTRGIEAGSGHTNVTIRNGRVQGFYSGLVIFARQSVIEDLVVADSAGDGINVIGDSSAAFTSVIRNNTIINTDIKRSGVTGFNAYGILTQGVSGLIEGNTILVVAGTTPIGGDEGTGIRVESASHMLVMNNRIAQADRGLVIISTGSYRDNATVNVGTKYSGGTDLGNNQ